MVTRWYAVKSDGKFWVSTDGLPVWCFSLDQVMDHIPNSHSYITHAGARKHKDYRFHWLDFGFSILNDDLPF